MRSPKVANAMTADWVEKTNSLENLIMEIKSVSVGGTFSSEVRYSNIKMDIVAEISPDDDLKKKTKALKVQLAKLVSGGCPDQMEEALKILNYPNLQNRKEELIGEFNELEADIAKLENKITERRTQLLALAGLAEDLDRLEKVCEFYGMTSDFWESVTAIMAKKRLLD
ncbi:MAG: hypothetical protein SWX82_33000 [Cyanobacteriota bacterium]|nr:hypothetical protein [Cyanobacteriota bacterium]